MFSVHIVLTDRNWILERLASEICQRYDYVTYDMAPDPNADIQYYMTYSARKDRLSPCEIGYFAHYEEAPQAEDAREKFWHAAKEVDWCVCHSHRYETLLREGGIQNVTTIAPGLDLDELQPKVKIGVVGRTYHTGRKGEALVQQVMDIPGLEWHFTGTGWPGPAQRIPEGKMGDFYNAMDYILVPSLYEGGPMCVAEALACGRPVIAPPVGWVTEFPHIEFETGDEESLRVVLEQVVAERQALRTPVEHITWEAWAAGHDQLFRQLSESLPVSTPHDQTFPGKVALCMDRREQVSKGGPAMRVPKTAQTLQRMGVAASLEDRFQIQAQDFDLVHSFNIWPPESAWRTVKRVKAAGKPLVFSPILLDLSERDVFYREIPKIFETAHSARDLDTRLARVREARVVARKNNTFPEEPLPGYYAYLRHIAAHTDHLICLSECEKALLQRLGATPRGGVSIVHNPVDAERFGNADPSLFEKEFGLRDYVLCVGRIETRKNQLMLLHALRDTDIPIVLLGHCGDKRYDEMIRRYADEKDTIHIIDRIDPESPLLPSAYAAARVFVLPSWSEGAALSALEAAAAGCALVLSNRSSEQEYFGDYARYIDPADPEGIRKEVQTAYDSPRSESQRAEQQAYVRENFSWERYAQATLRAYEETLKNVAPIQDTVIPESSEAHRIYIDITQSAYHPGPPSGIARVELTCALELKALLGDRVTFMFRNGYSKVFVPVAPEDVSSGAYKLQAKRPLRSMRGSQEEFSVDSCIDFEPGAILLVMGGAWIRQREYVDDLLLIKRAYRMILVVALYDVIRAKFPHLYPGKLVQQFVDHVALLGRHADRILTSSQCTAMDIATFLNDKAIPAPPIDCFRLGDDFHVGETVNPEDMESLAECLDGHPFVLCVSAIDVRKNHQLLYHLWIRLVEEYGDVAPHLVCVGAVSWHTEDLRALMTTDARVKDRLHVLHGIEDATLEWLYQNCLFTVYPSLYEGWGLPIAESLAHGKICIASNTSSMTEIAPEVTDLLDPLDFVAWYGAVVRYAFSETLRARREAEIQEGYTIRSWTESAQKVAEILALPLPEPEHFPLYPAGMEIAFSRKRPENSLDVSPFLAGGWGSLEESGTWSVAKQAKIGLNVIDTGDRPVMLMALVGRYDKQPDPFLKTRLFCNDQPLGGWDIHRASFRRIVVPKTMLSQEGINATQLFHFDFENPVRPSEVEASAKDNRLLGARFISLQLVALDPCDLNVNVPMNFMEAKCALSQANLLGWRCHADQGLVMTGEDAVFPFRCAFPEEQDIVLEIALKGATPLKMPGKVAIRMNGQLLGESLFNTGASATLRLVVPRECFVQDGLQTLSFHTNDVTVSAVLDATTYDSGLRGIALTGLSLTPLEESTELPRAAIGETIDFGLQGEGAAFLQSGWCTSRDQGVWSQEEHAALCMALDTPPPQAKALRISLRGKALKGHFHLPQSVDLMLNGKSMGTWLLNGPAASEHVLELPLNAVPPHALALRLRIQDPQSPAALGLGLDTRPLGIFLYSMRLDWLEG